MLITGFLLLIYFISTYGTYKIALPMEGHTLKRLNIGTEITIIISQGNFVAREKSFPKT